MKINNQSGFTHTMITVVIVVAVAVSGTGYLVLKNNSDSKTQPNASSAPSTSSKPSTSTKSNDEAAAKSAAKEHFTLVYQKKTQEAYDATCQDFKDLTPYTKFQSQLQSGGFYTIDLSAIEYTSVDIRNNQAKISGPVGPLQPGTNLEVSLLKKNGQWCVYGYQAK